MKATDSLQLKKIRNILMKNPKSLHKKYPRSPGSFVVLQELSDLLKTVGNLGVPLKESCSFASTFAP
jgi:hypothetical protein